MSTKPSTAEQLLLHNRLSLLEPQTFEPTIETIRGLAIYVLPQRIIFDDGSVLQIDRGFPTFGTIGATPANAVSQEEIQFLLDTDNVETNPPRMRG